MDGTDKKIMKVSMEIQNKMHKLAKISAQAKNLDKEIMEYFIGKEYDLEELYGKKEFTLDNLSKGNDITDQFVKDMESNKYTRYC